MNRPLIWFFGILSIGIILYPIIHSFFSENYFDAVTELTFMSLGSIAALLTIALDEMLIERETKKKK